MPISTQQSQPQQHQTQTLKLAYTTLLTDTNYLPGLLVLGYSLQKVKSKYPLVVMVPSNLLTQVSTYVTKYISNCKFVVTQPLYPSTSSSLTYLFPQFNETWSKLNIFQLVDYDYLCYLDSDMLITSNCDEILELASSTVRHRNDYNEDGKSGDGIIDMLAVHTCVCNPTKKPNYPTWWNPTNCVYTNANSIDTIIEVDPDIKLINVDSNSTLPSFKKQYFNSGLFIISPNLLIYNDMVKDLEYKYDLKMFQFPDQDYLNFKFLGKFRPLPLKYNLLKTIGISHPKLNDLDSASIIHFIMKKPWQFLNEKDSYATMDIVFDNDELRFEKSYRMWFKTYDEVLNIL